jgi:hypothetical protein
MFSLSPVYTYASTLLDFNESGASGTTWPGWTGTTVLKVLAREAQLVITCSRHPTCNTKVRSVCERGNTAQTQTVSLIVDLRLHPEPHPQLQLTSEGDNEGYWRDRELNSWDRKA